MSSDKAALISDGDAVSDPAGTAKSQRMTRTDGACPVRGTAPFRTTNPHEFFGTDESFPVTGLTWSRPLKVLGRIIVTVNGEEAECTVTPA